MLKPLGDRVLIQVIEEETTVGGIVLTSAAKEKPDMGEVIAIGDEQDIPVATGDKVMFEQYAGTKVSYEGNDYLIMHAKDIMAIVK